MSAILVIRLRGEIKIKTTIADTMAMLNLHHVNHATIVPDTPTFQGMLRKVKDYVTFGPIDAKGIQDLLEKRGRVEGDKPVTDAEVSARSDFKSVADLAQALADGKTKLADAGLKPVLRLAPPRKGHEGIKHSFRAGGALGDRGETISDFVQRMV